MIPDEAVEAAAKKMAGAAYGVWELVPEAKRRLYMRTARAALEAAAPHMMAEAWDACVDEAESLGWMHDAGAVDTKARNPYREPTP